jgi:hypothetical protein
MRSNSGQQGRLLAEQRRDRDAVESGNPLDNSI